MMNHPSTALRWPDQSGPWTRISRPFRLAFFSACLIGTITHLYLFTNLLLNHDSTNSLFTDNDVLSLGRWSLKYLSAFSSDFQLPVVIGVISIVMLALTAGLTVRILHITNRVNIVLTAALLVTYPSVASIFSYLFTADAYFIALFFCALGVWCAQRYRWGWTAAIALITVACGTYQAFVCYAIGLFLFDCLIRLLEGEAIPQVVARGMRYVLICVISLVLYYVVLQVMLAVTGTALDDYQGVVGIGLSSITAFLAQIPKAWLLFGARFFDPGYLSPLQQVLLALYCLFFAGLGLYLIWVRKLYRDLPRLLLILAGLLLIPLALDFIAVLALEATVHSLMTYSFVLFLVLILKASELAAAELLPSGGRKGALVFFANLALCAALVWGNFCVTNIAYLRMQVRYETSYAVANRVMARIESLEGYTPDTPVAIAGILPSGQYGTGVGDFARIDGLTGVEDNALLGTYAASVFLKTYTGLHMPGLTDEQWLMVYQSGILDTMPSYPAEGSIILHNGVVIVKLGEMA